MCRSNRAPAGFLRRYGPVFQVALTAFLVCSSAAVYSQSDKLSISVRVPFQLEFQKAVITYGRYEIQKNTAVNFGLEAALEKSVSPRLFFSIGAGYFRQRFNIRRLYDHQALNRGTDSLPFATRTSNYNYHLLRLPIGVRYFLSDLRGGTSVGITYVPAFSLFSRYNGGKIFPGANQQENRFRFFSHSLNLSASIPVYRQSLGQLNIEPYIRIFHNYKKDGIFFEKETETVSRNFDAVGVVLAYQFRFCR
jgi:hypothetical protein